MVQQQLVDYIKAQLGVGVGEEELESSLLDAGWNGTDIDDSMKSAASSGGAASDFSAAPGTAAAGDRIVVSDLIPSASKMEIAAVKPEKEKSANSESKAPPKSPPGPKSPESGKPDSKTTVVIILAAVALGLAGASVYLYTRMKSAEDKSASLLAASSASDSQITALNSQITDLTNAKNDLTSQIASLSSDVQKFTDELSFFVALPTTSSVSGTAPAAIPFTLSGVLSWNAKTSYTLTTADGVKIHVKNSGDAGVDAALKPLVGQSVEISGTHAPASKEAAVTAVNGADVSAPPVEASTSTPSGAPAAGGATSSVPSGASAPSSTSPSSTSVPSSTPAGNATAQNGTSTSSGTSTQP